MHTFICDYKWIESYFYRKEIHTPENSFNTLNFVPEFLTWNETHAIHKGIYNSYIISVRCTKKYAVKDEVEYAFNFYLKRSIWEKWTSLYTI